MKTSMFTLHPSQMSDSDNHCQIPVNHFASTIQFTPSYHSANNSCHSNTSTTNTMGSTLCGLLVIITILCFFLLDYGFWRRYQRLLQREKPKKFWQRAILRSRNDINIERIYTAEFPGLGKEFGHEM